MKYEQFENKIHLYDIDSFNIRDVLECGQLFRYEALDDGACPKYAIIAFGRKLYIRQTPESVEFYPCSLKDFEDIWIRYFDLNRNYNEIKKILSLDPVMERAIGFAGGIRLLNADPWECLISFIISQNNRIPMIKKVIANLSETFGRPGRDELTGNRYYAFPTPEALAAAPVEDIFACKTGFRDKYIKNAAVRVADGEIRLNDFEKLTTPELRDVLKALNGVGQKVADCVMLFSCGRREVFPIDVWVGRIMRELYFNGDAGCAVKDFHALAQLRFGQNAGIAQQYLFHYARMNRIGKTGKGE